MKNLFTAIRHNDLEKVKQFLEKNPALIACTAKQPPKKDDGQSPLQVALKTGNFDIAEYLLSLGADVTFMEDEACCNEWRAPVLHDAITATVMCSRWNVNSPIYGGLKVCSTQEKSDRAFEILKKIIALGADTNAKDSYGNSCLCRACLQARQILPSYNHIEQKLFDNRIITKELTADLSRIFDLLIKSGADINYVKPSLGRTVKEMYKNEPVARFLV